MPKVIVVNEERCLGCKQCMIECAMAHVEAGSLIEAINCESPPQPRIHVVPSGAFGIPLQCRHCEDAPCITVCPREAIHRVVENGPVLLDQEQCIGCKFCMIVCPFGVIYLPRDGKAMVKCDLCIERIEGDEEPACVAGCPTGALEFRELDDYLREHRRLIAEKVVAAPESSEKIGAECEACGKTFAPIKLLQGVRKKLPEDVPLTRICPSCRQLRTAESLSAISERLQNGNRPVESGRKKR
jgi:carbon-monoxide dehydrogenase iron sulfur subunit